MGKSPFIVLLSPSLGARRYPRAPVRGVAVPALGPSLEHHVVTGRTPHPVTDNLPGGQFLRVEDDTRGIGLGQERALPKEGRRREEPQDPLVEHREQGGEGDAGVIFPELLGSLPASQGIGQGPNRDVGSGEDGGPVIECPDCALRGRRPRHHGAPSVAGALTRPGVAR